MVSIRTEAFDDVWFAVAEDERNRLLSSSFSLEDKREAVRVVIQCLPRGLRDQAKEVGRESPNLRMMYKLYLGETLQKHPSLEMRYFSPFRKRVYQAARRIPKGFVSTYGLIAAKAGNRLAYRAAGNAMRTNPFTLFVPCHRAVPSTMDVGRYSLSLDDDFNPEIKRALLVREGVEFERGKISRKSLWRFKSGDKK